jgi:CBS domain-containing protein
MHPSRGLSFTEEAGEMAKTVGQVMTSEPRSVDRSTTIRTAAELMARDDVGSLPVVDEQGDLVGIVTDRDIVVRVVAAGRDVDQVKVGDIHTEHPVLVFPDDPLSDAMDLMAEHQIRRLPVVMEKRLVGMLAQADVAQEAKDKQAGQVLEAISQQEAHA